MTNCTKGYTNGYTKGHTYNNQTNVKHQAPTGSKARVGKRQPKMNRLWVQNCANHILADTNHKDNTLNLFF